MVKDTTLEKLRVCSVSSQLFGKQPGSTPEINEMEFKQLLRYASVLSLSDKDIDKSLCYEIAVRLIDVNVSAKYDLTQAIGMIFSRLGNFPGRKLLEDRASNKLVRSTSMLMLERLGREVENTIFIDSEEIRLTDFQSKFYSELKKRKYLSVSAPTSAGKSFILSLGLVTALKEKLNQRIVYVVPTRALISEVSDRIRISLNDYSISGVKVRTAPFAHELNNSDRGVVYVFTQERLINYLSEIEPKASPIDLLIVDEAHEIQKGKRGILLQSAIEYLVFKYNNVKVLFCSPLINNPDIYFECINATSTGYSFVEEVSPVLQNVILVKEVQGNGKKVEFDLLVNDATVALGVRDIDFHLRNKKPTQKANLALNIVKEDESIVVFSNGPSDAEKVAKEISMRNKYILTENVSSFIDFLYKEIHPEYPLIDCLKGGAGFHYGKMPSIVRAGVENLFRSGEIKFLCCTSTLLQGVNLPTKHILIESPKSGDKPMSRSDFLNLSGRAGRLLKEFQGNIWCLRPNKWQESSYRGLRLQTIKPSVDLLMEDGGKIIQSLLDEDSLNKSDLEQAEAVFSKIYQDYHWPKNKHELEQYRTEENSKVLDTTIQKVSELKILLPEDIIQKNRSIRPDNLQKLYGFLLEAECIEDYIPLRPYEVGFIARLKNIMIVFKDVLGWNITQGYINLLSRAAQYWITEQPLRQILSNQVAYHKEKSPSKEVSQIIRDYLSILDKDIRFNAVKFFSAYSDVLNKVCMDLNKKELAENIEPYHIYMEFGSCNKDTLNIMALGCSRFTALYISKEVKFELEKKDVESYYELLTKVDIESINMPDLCKRELKSVLM
ncbi:DEAD/DEAH box helicase [Cobetia sp. AM6]|uniref:DEAD/DEAH box helicase n=1 Tax=Cobetia sp. AM6 TaxID=2661553 RepID=UPI001299440F|nr:DEAD/DEAH box helicase [Cobetia sp. AM6]BBO56060.1 DEAD/DEAH box helicase [Cobetia sp. AM6]